MVAKQKICANCRLYNTSTFIPSIYTALNIKNAHLKFLLLHPLLEGNFNTKISCIIHWYLIFMFCVFFLLPFLGVCDGFCHVAGKLLGCRLLSWYHTTSNRTTLCCMVPPCTVCCRIGSYCSRIESYQPESCVNHWNGR